MPLVGNGGGSAGEAGDAEETAFLLQSDLDSPGPHVAGAAQQSPGCSDDSRKVEADFPGAATLPAAEMPMLAEGEAEKAFFDVSNCQVKSGTRFKSGSMFTLQLPVSSLIMDPYMYRVTHHSGQTLAFVDNDFTTSTVCSILVG